MTLVDTSVWVDHLRAGNAPLAALLNGSRVLMHSFVRGELACTDDSFVLQTLRQAFEKQMGTVTTVATMGW